MSRRKQSNPKPLKVDEDGGKEPQKTTNGNEEDMRSKDTKAEVEPCGSGGGSGSGSPRSNHSGGGSGGGYDLGKGIRIRSCHELTATTNDGYCDEDDGAGGDFGSRNRGSAKRQRLRPTPQEDDLSQDEDSHGSRSPMGSTATAPSPFTAQQMLAAAAAGFPYLQHMNMNFGMRNDLKVEDAARLFFMPPELIPSTVPGAGATTSNNANGGGGGSSSGSSRGGSGGRVSSKSSAEAKVVCSADLSPRTGPAYICEPCNIKFSSANTLEAHQTYYCSFRKEFADKHGAMAKAATEKMDLVPEFEIEPSAAAAGSRTRTRTPSSVSQSQAAPGPGSDIEDEPPTPMDANDDDDERELSIDESRIQKQEMEQEHDDIDSHGDPNRSLKTGKQHAYACMYCSYSAEKKVSLNRHMRMHSGTTNANPNEDSRSCSTPFKSQSQEPGPGPGPSSSSSSVAAGTAAGGIVAMECYCTDCDIQFSKVKTYRVHKQYYCSTRHVLKGQAIGAGGVSGPGGSSPTTPTSSTAQPQTAGTGSPPPALHGHVSTRQSSSCRNSPSASASLSCSPPAGVENPGGPGPFLLLPTNPVILVPYCFVQAATLLPGNMLPTQNALVVLPNGIVQGLPNTLVLPPPPQDSISGPSTSPNAISSNSLNLPQFMFDDPKEVIKRMSGSRKRSHAHAAAAASSDESAKEEATSGMREHRRERERDVMDLSVTLQRPGSVDVPKGGSGSTSSLSNGSRSSSHAQLHTDDHDHLEQMEPQDGQDQTHIGRNRSPERVQLLLNSSGSGSGGLKRSGSAHSYSHSHSSRPSSASVSSTCSTSPPAASESPTKSGSGSALPLNGLKLERLSPTSFSQLSESQQQLLLYQHQIQQQQHAAAKMLQAQAQSTSSTRNHTQARSSSKSGSSSSSHANIATTFPGGAVLTATNPGGPPASLAELLMATATTGADVGDNLRKLNSSAAAMMAAAAASFPPELAIRLLSDPNYLSSIQQTIAAQQQQQQGLQLKMNSSPTAAAAKGNAGGTPSPAPALAPPIKRGVSRCVECDIVFYKYENYLVHKEHYCAARGNVNPSAVGAGAGASLVNGNTSSDEHRLHISPPLQLPPPATATRQRRGGQGGARQSLNSNSQLPSTRSRNSNNKMADEGMLSVSRSPPGATAGVSLPGVTITPTTALPQSQPQYACLHCGVKFSSLDTLKTHQSFYCPNFPAKRPPPPIPDTDTDADVMEGAVDGEMELQIATLQQEQQKANSKSASTTVGIVTCGKCKLVIPEDQLNVHGAMCNSNTSPTAAGAPAPGWKCPCCETYSPTMSSAQKHLETHSGLRAFKCVLCGYRGNTIRGMRTHIRMHFDKRVSNELHEADYITCITSKDLEPSAGALKMAHSNSNSNSNSPSQSQTQKSSSPPMALTLAANTGAGAKNLNNNNNTTTATATSTEDGVDGVLPAGGHHVTTTKATMLYVT